MKFKHFEKVKHVKTGNIYSIIGTPEKLMLEKTTEPAYAYQRYGKPKDKIWIRSQKEMEDGRFVIF